MQTSTTTISDPNKDPFTPKHSIKTFETSNPDGTVVVHGVIDGYGKGIKGMDILQEGMKKFLDRWFMREEEKK